MPIITLPRDDRWGQLGAGLGNLLGSVVQAADQQRIARGVAQVDQDPSIDPSQKFSAILKQYGPEGASLYGNLERARMYQEQLRAAQEERQSADVAWPAMLQGGVAPTGAAPASAALGLPTPPAPVAAGDTVKGSWFGNAPGWVDRMDSGLQASGKPVAEAPGIALPSRATLGQKFDVTTPEGRTFKGVEQTDVGPSKKTGRGVDVNATEAQKMGYTPATFPTDKPFKVTPADKTTVRADDLANDAMSGVSALQYGQMQRKQLAQAIEKANPDAPTHVKMMAFERASKMLAPEERMMWEIAKTHMNADARVAIAQMQGEIKAQITERTTDTRVQAARDIAEARAERQNWEVYTDPGNENRPYRMNKATGETVDFSGQPYTPGGVSKAAAPGAGGRQAETMGLRITQAGNEAVAALGNLVDLPISATTGWFMGVQTDKPKELTDALKHSLASHLTADESKAVITSFQGVARSLAILEAAGSAQGLVGLSQAAQTLAPQAGDDGPSVLRKYAEIRQVVDRAVDTLKVAPSFQSQKPLLDKLDQIKVEAAQSVPWTVKDVNALQRNPSDERVADFASKMQVAGGAHRAAAPAAAQPTQPAAEPREGLLPTPNAAQVDMLRKNDTPELRQWFDKKFGPGAAERVLK